MSQAPHLLRTATLSCGPAMDRAAASNSILHPESAAIRSAAPALDPAVTAVVAIGGNSLIRTGQTGSIPVQLANARATCRSLVELIREGLHIVITHGNGPQVGAALLRSEQASDLVYPHSLDVCGATSQGEIGYVLAQALRESLDAADLSRPVAALLTHVVVCEDDPAMLHPSKPIGPFYSQRDAEDRRQRLGWHIVEDAGRGYRRVVPSPEPVEILEENVIQMLLARGVAVVAVGGGGIPVVRQHGVLRGVEAVIDKDRASALLASRIGAHRLIISTDADQVYLDFRRPSQQGLRTVSAAQVSSYREDGQFPQGSMGPKIDAALQFLGRGGREVIITAPAFLVQALHGLAGTRIVRS